MLWKARAYALLLATSLPVHAAVDATPESAIQSRELIAWVKERAVPLKAIDSSDEGDADLRAALEGLVTPQTRVIALGEGGYHNSHEMLVLRNRLFEYLVRHHGVTALLTESMFYGGFAVDDYVVHGGELTPQLVASVYCWTDPKTAWEENASLLKWMREYNGSRRAGRPLRFYAGTGDWDDAKDGDPAPISLRYALGYLRRVDAKLANGLESRVSWSGRAKYADLKEAKRDEMTAALADLVNAFKANHLKWTRATSVEDFGRAWRSAVRAGELDAWRRRQLQAGGVAPLAGWQEADNILAALESEGPQGRLFVFYHNGHSDNSADSNSFGPRLREVLQSRYVQIGTAPAWDPSSPHDRASIERQLALAGGSWSGWDPREGGPEQFLSLLYRIAGFPAFYLDMRNMPPVNVPIGTWRQGGSSYVAEASNEAGPAPDHARWKAQSSFDAMIFLPPVNPARPWQHD